MKAVITDGSGGIRLTEVLKPEVGDYGCLCEILAWATCSGTDQKIVSGGLPWKETYPGVLGHESVGRVIEVGRKVRYIKEGDLFLRPTSVYPGDKLGEYASLWGGFAEYGLVTDTKAQLEDKPDVVLNGYCIYQQKIPSEIGIDPGEATMLITLKECASFVANVGVRFNTSVVILGSGPVAAGMVFFSKLYGAGPVIAVGRRDEPLARLEKVGVDAVINNQTRDMAEAVKELTGGKGVDFVLDCAGDGDLVTASSSILASGGRLAPYALGHGFSYQMDRSKGPDRWDFVFANPSENLAHTYLMDLARLDMIPLSEFYSHRLPFYQVKEGFQLLRNKQASKVIFELNH